MYVLTSFRNDDYYIIVFKYAEYITLKVVCADYKILFVKISVIQFPSHFSVIYKSNFINLTIFLPWDRKKDVLIYLLYYIGINKGKFSAQVITYILIFPQIYRIKFRYLKNRKKICIFKHYLRERKYMFF